MFDPSDEPHDFYKAGFPWHGPYDTLPEEETPDIPPHSYPTPPTRPSLDKHDLNTLVLQEVLDEHTRRLLFTRRHYIS